MNPPNSSSVLFGGFFFGFIVAKAPTRLLVVLVVTV